MVERFKFTFAKIKNLPVPEKGADIYYDDEEKKLCLRISKTGYKSYLLVKYANNNAQRISIGNAEEISVTEARKRAKELLTDISNGINPVEERRKQKLEQTVLGDVLELYLSERDLKPYTIKNYRYKLKLGFEDWLNTPVNLITEDMILKRHKLLSQTGKTTANTTMRVLRLTLNYADAVGMLENNPASILSKARLWHKNNRKNRVIHSDQLQAWHEAVEALQNHKAKVYLFMALYMGFRSTELLTMQWTNVNLKDDTITIYDTKNGTNHRLPIPTILLPYINDLNNVTGTSKWMFEGDVSGKPMTPPIKPIKRVIDVSGVEFSPHDCRRTFATIAEAVNLPMSMIKRLMNHVTSNDVTGGYIVTEEETLREALNKVADYIQNKIGIIAADNIVRFKVG